MNAPGSYEFGPFRVEIAKRQLYRDGNRLPAPKMVFSLLAILVTHHNQAISNQLVSDTLWPGNQGTDQKLKNLFSRLCQLIDDGDGEHRKYINRDGDGYFRFLVRVNEGRQNDSITESSGQERRLAFSISTENEKKWDAFVAVPMAAITPEQYTLQHTQLNKVIRTLRREWGGKKIYCPAEHIARSDQWDPPDIAMTRGLKAIASSRIFIMIYSADKPSSILVEAGFALAHNIPSVYFVKDDFKLPFLLHAANQAFSEVKVYPFSKFDDIVRIMREYKDELSAPLHIE